MFRHDAKGRGVKQTMARTLIPRAVAAGATKIDTKAVEGKPVDTLKQVVSDVGADLLVVGNVGLNTLAGRILGSVPLDVARHAGVDVLIVHTS